MHPADLRKKLAEGRKALRAEFDSGLDSSRLLRLHSDLVDGLLESLWKSLRVPSSVSLLATGGYGRRQLFPCSDIDVLILLQESESDNLREILENLIVSFWDAGLEVGHSVRTIEECISEAQKDITVQTNILESRLLAGSEAHFDEFRKRLHGEIDAQSFYNAKLLEQQQRHLRFHDTTYNLEPNLKEGPGGLRDLQNILWISRASDLGNSWKSLSSTGIMSASEAATVSRHHKFLDGLRIRLHYLAGRREDRLLFDYQNALAADLGISGSGSRRASEELMQRYYRTAKAVSRINTILLQNLREKIFPSPTETTFALDANFNSSNELLDVKEEDQFERFPTSMLEAFLLLERHPELKGMSARTLRALWRAASKIGHEFRNAPENRILFMQILREPKGITHTLRLMNQYGFLGKYIPAFGRIVGRMQHDLFHVYTVDEHILKVVRNLRRFQMSEHAHEYPFCSRLIAEFERPEVLFLAGLFHDIAKGRNGDHSRLGKKDALRFCRQHQLDEEDSRLVAELVGNHLVMSSTAQKMDLSDPDVIANFAALVGNERHLTALYLLTVSDIRGTSPTVWNAWKEKLLEDLFLSTRRYLRGDKPTPVGNLQNRQNEAKRLLQLYAIAPESADSLWSKLDIGYFLQHESNEIAWHSRILFDRVESPAPIVRARMSPIGEGLQVLIYARKRNDLFAHISGFFEKIGYTIAEAKIHSTRHGYSLNSFLVLDPEKKTGHYRDLISFIEHDLSAILKSDKPLSAPPQSRLSRHLKHFPITPQVRIFPDDKGIYQIMTVIAGDRPGLLSRISRVLMGNSIEVHSAKVNTLGERAEDVFLISGRMLDEQKEVIRIESELIGVLQT